MLVPYGGGGRGAVAHDGYHAEVAGDCIVGQHGRRHRVAQLKGKLQLSSTIFYLELEFSISIFTCPYLHYFVKAVEEEKFEVFISREKYGFHGENLK